ncbi:MAG TPA: NAD(P)H-dependent glycerol-3-phosphate dehydrogenase [Burkholderiaceae bacterium]|nr:NAD(P)H-dependent glycerol-3-phosphate dehydrogenase [Burkholderiaceae bacterium]
MRIGVLGAGSWGTALAVSLALQRRHEVVLWARDASVVRSMRDTRANTAYLPNVALPEALGLTDDFAVAARADLLVIATPVAGLRSTLQRLRGEGGSSDPTTPIVWLCKGLEATTRLLPHQVVAECLPGRSCGVLSGPSFAAEVARGLPCALVLASHDAGFATHIARVFHGGAMRVYASDDLVGVEIGGAVKNVMAIATGVSDGLGLGHNARAALVTRGLAEITRLGCALGARVETFMGLAGLGDLMLTCTGDLSRNRRVGLALGQGQSLEQALGGLGHVAEGVQSARAVRALAQQHGVSMPITEAVCAVLFEGLSPSDALGALLAREPRSENHFS